MVKTELVISYIFNFTRWFEDNDFIFRDHNNFSAANSCNIVVSTEGLISISMYSTSYCPYQSNDPYVKQWRHLYSHHHPPGSILYVILLPRAGYKQHLVVSFLSSPAFLLPSSSSSSIYFTLFGVYITLEEILIMYIRYKYIKQILNYDIEIVHDD
jgi:hypothetical protein